MSAINLSYGNFSIDFASLPAASQDAIANEGFTHYLGNRVASKVVGSFRSAARAEYIKVNGGDAWKALSKAEQTSAEKDGIPPSDSPEYQAALDAARAETFEAMKAGTLGVSERAPSMSPFDAEVAKFVKEQVLDILKGQGLWKGAKNPTPETVFAFANGDRTFASLLDGWLAKNTDEAHKHANKVLADREKARKAATQVNLDEVF